MFNDDKEIYEIYEMFRIILYKLEHASHVSYMSRSFDTIMQSWKTLTRNMLSI